MNPSIYKNYNSRKRIALIVLFLSLLLWNISVPAQNRNTLLPVPLFPSSNIPNQDIFPDALSGMDLYYKIGMFGEVELTLKKYFGSHANIGNTPEKLIIRESITGMVSAQPIMQLQSIKTDTAILNVRCAGYNGAFVKVATYTAKVKLMSPMMGGFDVTLGYCCWDLNPNLVNIQGMREGKKQGMSLNLHIPEIASTDSNSSPIFQTTPVLTTCVNQLLSFLTSAYDKEKDSLGYAFCPIDDFKSENGFENPAVPYIKQEQFLNITFPGAKPPFKRVDYTNGYDFSKPMKAKQMIIDSRSGMITMKPETVGDYLIGVAVNEYRNGKLLGTYKRVFKIKVVS